MAQQQYKQSLGGFIWQSALGIALLLFISWAAIKVANNLSIEPVFALAFMVVGLLVIFLLFRLLFPPIAIEAVQNAEYWQQIAEEHEQTISNLQAEIANGEQINSKGHQIVADYKQAISILNDFAADIEQCLGNEKHILAKYKHSNSTIIQQIISYLNENLTELNALREDKKEFQNNFNKLANEKMLMVKDVETMNFIRNNFGQGREIAELLATKELQSYWTATEKINKALAAKRIENPNKL